MECVTPPLHRVIGKATQVTEDAEPVELHIGLKMDNATGLLHLSSPHSSRPDLVLHYVRDPLYSNFSNNLKVYKGDELVIEGSRLNVASDQVQFSYNFIALQRESEYQTNNVFQW